MDMLEWVQRGK